MSMLARALTGALASLLIVGAAPPASAAPPAAIPHPLLTAPGAGVEVVSTTRDAGYRETGTWTQAQRTGYRGGTTRFTREVGATASWTLTAPAEDEYTIGVWIPFSSDVNDPATTYSWDGAAPVKVNQAAIGDAWHTIGTVRLAAGASLTVTVTARTSGKVTRADAVRLRSTKPSQDVLVNQSGYDLGASKRFTAPRAEDGSPFTVTREGSSTVLFSGTVTGGAGDFTAFNPSSPGPYVITVTGTAAGTGTSHPFGIGANWTYRVSLQRAIDFMVESRCAHGDATKLVFTDPAGNRCNRGNTGVAWRDDHQFSFSLQGLISMYLANPDAFTGTPGTGRYDGLAIPTTPDAPEIAKLVNWGVDLYLQGQVNHDLLKEQLAWFVHAYPHFSRWIPREQYVKARDHLVRLWGDPARDRWNWYDIAHTADLFQTYTVIGTGKGQFPPGHSIVPNLMMYEVAKRDGLPDPDRYLAAATAQAKWIVDNLDWNAPGTTKGQRMSEHVTVTSLVYLLRNHPDAAPPGLAEKIRQWADVLISRSANMWDFRKYSADLWIIPEFNEPGNVAGLPAAALAAAGVIDDAATAKALRRIAASHIDNVFGRNPADAHFSHDAATAEGFEGVERGWPKEYPPGRGAGELEEVRGVLDGSPKEASYPYDPNADLGYTEGWVAFNSAWNASLAQLSADRTKLHAPAAIQPGQSLSVRLRAALNLDAAAVETGRVRVTTSGGDSETFTVTEAGKSSRDFVATPPTATGTVSADDGRLQVLPGQTITIRYGLDGFAKKVTVRVVP
ncbi:hypothetical protein GCM10010517_40000 [Streptosporangium fragile]|uniref:Golvesin/Xly CBD-like domain-containing protein n=1 Tax=Streptosporangium fragile TaxID=46186 RepID=A0ABN3W1Y4_9ACTN